MKFWSHIKILALCCACAATLSTPARADITVFAAASLRGALDEVALLSTSDVTISYGGSGTLARQVSQGAPADVVILAHPRWMDWLEAQDVIVTGTRTTVAQNCLVLIGQRGAKPLPDLTEIIERLGQGRLAMGQREAVPAGIYARQWLEHIGQWSALEPRLAEVENVRLALAFVARAETPLGIVYGSDAQADPQVEVLYVVPDTTHDPITYPAAAITQEGRDFIDLLTSVQATQIFVKHGFTTQMATQ